MPAQVFSRVRRAFTLVELLVVIGIIAVLIGILLPALNSARQKAQTIACLSNLRELSNALRLYAAQFKDAFPIGYIDQAAFNYVANFNNGLAGNYVARPGIGLLWDARLMPSGKTFFCPSETDPLWQYDTSINPWIFDDEPQHPWLTVAGVNRHVRVGYGCRPSVNWLPAVRNTDPRPGVPALPFDNIAATNAGNPTRAFPKLSKFKNKAVLADLFWGPAVVRYRHKTVINVMYANGSAVSVPCNPDAVKNVFTNTTYVPAPAYATWKTFTNIAPPSYNYIFLYENESNRIAYGTTQGLWYALDKF